MASETSGRTLVLGLGNDILTDDAVGLLAARRLQAELAGQPDVDIQETTEMGLALLDFFTGYSRVFLVDSIQTGQAPPGFIHELDAASLKQLTGRTPHFLGVGETLSLGHQLGLPMPDRVTIFAIEVSDPFTLSTQMTPLIEAALPRVVERIKSVLSH
jgi:hydrogenase maturation protease